ncbi:MAG: phosphoesterase, partial [Proteobacteria bacterium]|nr:phosphoesterase [Desulfobacula sp.]MBU4130608.1 phosphoesterase [Pseudomonadota bacterium]
MNKNESVLCIHRDRLPLSWVTPKSVVPLALSAFVHQCALSGFEFVNRREAEKDPSLKQVIPYIVLQTKNLELTAIYNRQGSEKRLHD